jgi:plasmid maintenance system killer protein
MDITFANTSLKKQRNEEKAMIKAHGPLRTKKLKIVMAQLRAAPSLDVFAPPMSPPNRCHELIGNRKGQLSVDLDHPYRLLFKPDHDPLPQRAEGGLDWKQVTNIKIIGIEDTHG